MANLETFYVHDNQLSGDVPAVPNPNSLGPGWSSLCPNALTRTDNADWDTATGLTPWHTYCHDLPDAIFYDGFEGD